MSEGLSPAPWSWSTSGNAFNLSSEDGGGNVLHVATNRDGVPGIEGKEADMAFIVLARVAFEVMQKRGWGVGFASQEGPNHGWFVTFPVGMYPPSSTLYPLLNMRSPNPFAVLVEADKWWQEHVGT